MNDVVKNFTLHNDIGDEVLETDLLKWAERNGGSVFGTTEYSWEVNTQSFHMKRDRLVWHVLPDASGFICFESSQVPNNCTLLDAYGRERMRLTVPWQLTAANNPASNDPPTFFLDVSETYINPADGGQGKFGVKAWVEFAGEYYFELDWHTGKFLWGKEVRF